MFCPKLCTSWKGGSRGYYYETSRQRKGVSCSLASSVSNNNRPSRRRSKREKTQDYSTINQYQDPDMAPEDQYHRYTRTLKNKEKPGKAQERKDKLIELKKQLEKDTEKRISHRHRKVFLSPQDKSFFNSCEVLVLKEHA